MEENKTIKQTKHGWVDLSNLKRTKGGKINWKESVGLSVEFQYLDVRAVIYIVDWVDSYTVKIIIPEYINECTTGTVNIINGRLGFAVGKIVRNFRYNVGDIVNKTMLITSAYRFDGLKYYTYRCLKDGYEGRIIEPNIQKGMGCSACAGKTVIRGVNDITTTYPHIASLFWNVEDTYKYSAFSGEMIDFRCPRCGSKIQSRICDVSRRGLSCKKCSDGISYSEKFIYNFLQQLSNISTNINGVQDFIPQHVFDWSKDVWHNNSKLRGCKRYDFYIPTKRDICIECHGGQHYDNSFEHTGGKAKTVTEEKENDQIKMNLALNNGILPDHYIQLDCRESSVEHIKKSIMMSHLPRLLNFTEDQIDWNQCGLFAMSSRMIEACDLWNSGIHSREQIGEIMKLHKSTIYNYLRRGEELGIVQDPPKHIKKKTQQND